MLHPKSCRDNNGVNAPLGLLKPLKQAITVCLMCRILLLLSQRSCSHCSYLVWEKPHRQHCTNDGQNVPERFISDAKYTPSRDFDHHDRHGHSVARGCFSWTRSWRAALTYWSLLCANVVPVGYCICRDHTP